MRGTPGPLIYSHFPGQSYDLECGICRRKGECYVAQAGLKLAIQTRITLNSYSPCLHLPVVTKCVLPLLAYEIYIGHTLQTSKRWVHELGFQPLDEIQFLQTSGRPQHWCSPNLTWELVTRFQNILFIFQVLPNIHINLLLHFAFVQDTASQLSLVAHACNIHTDT